MVVDVETVGIGWAAAVTGVSSLLVVGWGINRSTRVDRRAGLDIGLETDSPHVCSTRVRYRPREAGTGLQSAPMGRWTTVVARRF
jgi:hypothetical protein